MIRGAGNIAGLAFTRSLKRNSSSSLAPEMSLRLIRVFRLPRASAAPLSNRVSRSLSAMCEKDSRYLPTFHTTRSEIIVPMTNGHRHIVGMLDAESEEGERLRRRRSAISRAGERADCALFDLTRPVGAMARLRRAMSRSRSRRSLLLRPDSSSKNGVRRSLSSLLIAMMKTGMICGFSEIRRTQFELARFDDAGNYRPLKTAPNLRHGWRLETRRSWRAAASAWIIFIRADWQCLAAWNENRLTTTPLRQTLNRQSGMYRVAAKISDEQIDDVVGEFLPIERRLSADDFVETRCSKAHFHRRKLPPEKFDPHAIKREGALPDDIGTMIPLLVRKRVICS